jgi:DNA (cytosine-5)-methyltransferase 1
MMTIYTVEPWLKAVKPGTFSLEQADGLLILHKHRMYFRYLIRSIGSQGYNVRWRIQDQAWFGLAQHRRRLIFVGSKYEIFVIIERTILTFNRIGIPLPPFPAPTHGPPGSGLKRYVTIEDSLKVIERQSTSLRYDPYHQAHREKRTNVKAIDPHVSLAKCITTNGGDNVHYSGKRTYTVRELASFQGIGSDFHFTGSVSEAKKQCGNVWPPGSNTAYFRVWAAHREAFDNGYLDAEDEVLDLHDVLEAKGIPIPKPPVIDVDIFDVPARRAGNPEPDFRYLPRIEKAVRPNYPLQIWAKYKDIDPLPQRPRKKHAIASHIVNRTNGAGEDRDVDIDTTPRPGISSRHRRCVAVYIDDEDEPTWIDESD